MAYGAPQTRAVLAGATLLVTSSLIAVADDIRPIADIIARLDAPSLNERELAMLELLERSGELSDAIGVEIHPEALTPEQRTRIVSTLRQRFILTPRAGLGARIGEADAAGGKGALIAGTVPDFPAARLLQDNDIVLEAHGVDLVGLPFRQADLRFRCAILSLEPGEAIHLRIQRNGEVLELDVPTRSFAELDNPNALQPDQNQLEGAWRVRAERLGLSSFDVERLTDAQKNSWVAQVKRRNDVPAVIPGGQAQAVENAERSRAALAKLDNDQNQRMRLADEERARHLERFIVDLRTRLNERRTALGNEMPGTKSAMRLQSDIREYERQLQQAQQQYKETRARLGQLRNP